MKKFLKRASVFLAAAFVGFAGITLYGANQARKQAEAQDL